MGSFVRLSLLEGINKMSLPSFRSSDLRSSDLRHRPTEKDYFWRLGLVVELAPQRTREWVALGQVICGSRKNFRFDELDS